MEFGSSMSKYTTCGECRYFQEEKFCHANPPTIVTFPMTNKLTGETKMASASHRPTVNATDFRCKKFEAE